eukprot:10706858-Ditylum_brightwellii.AAC.1
MATQHESSTTKTTKKKWSGWVGPSIGAPKTATHAARGAQGRTAWTEQTTRRRWREPSLLAAATSSSRPRTSELPCQPSSWTT